MTVLAVIPARAGSKGVPGKNLREVGGRTLLARAIAACRPADGIDHVFVSTDSLDIRNAAIAAGAEAPVLRPDELATDAAPILPVLRHAVETVERRAGRVETIVLVEPTSPFRTGEHVAAALARFRDGDCRSVATVVPLDRKPENIFVKERYLRRYIERPAETFAHRQQMAHLCRLNSAVYVTGRDDILAGRLLPGPIGYIEMDTLTSVNIDTPLDLEFAAFLAERHGL